jgi:tripartite-type tricarboxylate transporter receptor subunit TctC
MTRSFSKFLTASVAVFAVTVTAGLATAADFPTKPITMLIGFNPGGAVDTTGRVVADKMSKILGQPVVAVTKSGGGGTVMAAQLINAAPDGYTIGMGASAAYTLTPQINKDIKFKIDDFTHLATLTYPSDAIVVKASSPWKTLDDMIQSSKKSGKAISFATQVSASRLMVMAITDKSGVEFKQIPVKGGAVGIQDVLGGHIDTTWSGSGWTEQVRAGNLRALATMSSERMKDYPDIPTLLELGYNFTFTDTFMLSAPKGVPADVVAKLDAAIKQAINDPEVQKILHDKIKLLTKYRDSKATTAFLKKQYADVEPLVKKLK